jgi:hypothetical protein
MPNYLMRAILAILAHAHSNSSVVILAHFQGHGSITVAATVRAGLTDRDDRRMIVLATDQEGHDMGIHKTYRLPATGDALMVEIVEIAGAPEYTDASGVYNTTNLALYAELGNRAAKALKDTPAAVRVFMRREAPYRGEVRPWGSALAGQSASA